ncbi:MAG: hypothetical protein QXP88_01230 [Thermoproteota archaeon]
MLYSIVAVGINIQLGIKGTVDETLVTLAIVFTIVSIVWGYG